MRFPLPPQLYYYLKTKVMAKINFKKEHFDKMLHLAVGMLISNEVVTTKMGQPLNIVELLHTTTIGTLNNIRVSISKQITSIEERDEWVETNDNQKQLDKLKTQKELVNLIIGYKRYLFEAEETAKRKEELKKELDALKDAQKTPEDKIKELEDELNSLEDTQF